MSVVEIKVPDIGDFDAVEVIEVLIKAGDTVAPEQSLIVLESDKASMEVPSDVAGKIVDVKVKVGDKVSKGTVIATAEAGAAAAPAPAQAPAPVAAPAAAPAASAPAPQAAKHAGGADIECDMLVLGSGPGGYSAAFRSADLGMNTVLVERFSTLGGVCLNVGCIPSKALLHTAAVMDEVKAMAAHGIVYSEPTVDINQLRKHKESVIGKLTGGLAGMAKARKVQVVRGVGTFLDPNHLEVQLTDGAGKAQAGDPGLGFVDIFRFDRGGDHEVPIMGQRLQLAPAAVDDDGVAGAQRTVGEVAALDGATVLDDGPAPQEMLFRPEFRLWDPDRRRQSPLPPKKPAVNPDDDDKS